MDGRRHGQYREPGRRRVLSRRSRARARYERQGGEMFHAGYASVFSDNEFSHRAFKDGVVIDKRSELVFDHHHPAFGKGKMDATYQHTNAADRYKAGEALFKARNPDAK